MTKSSPAGTRDHRVARKFRHSPAEVFAALITPSQICHWWSADRAIVIPTLGGIWCAAWGDDEDNPDYISAAIIKGFEPDHLLVLGDYQYVSPDGLPFDADFECTFTVKEVDGGAELTVVQAGFPTDPIADDYFEGCESGWSDSLDSLEEFLDEK